MEKDPGSVERLAAERAEENWKFRGLLKRLSPRRRARVDALAEQLGRQAAEQMDCRTCGACCRTHHVPVDDVEVERLASLAELPILEFRQRHIEPGEDGEPSLRPPCVFLEGNSCSVYERRPEACRGYPYLGGDVASRMVGIIERAGTCPIVFEMLEGLKREMGFGRYL